MPQLSHFNPTYTDPATGKPRRSALVTMYREGATVNGNQSGTSPFTVTVIHPGKILASDAAFIGTSTGTIYSVGSPVTATTVILSGFVGTLSVSNGDRITPSNALPTIYQDDRAMVAAANPLTTNATGDVSCWAEFGPYDVLVSGAGIATRSFISIVVGVEAKSLDQIFIQSLV